jgi:hypothetical protein
VSTCTECFRYQGVLIQVQLISMATCMVPACVCQFRLQSSRFDQQKLNVLLQKKMSCIPITRSFKSTFTGESVQAIKGAKYLRHVVQSA